MSFPRTPAPAGPDRWGLVLALLLAAASILPPVPAAAQVAGPNVNMVSGTTWPTGDPFLQRQNEPSIAVSTRNPLHLLAGANDYRTVDLPGLPEGKETGDAWLGVFRSVDGGGSWKSTLVRGYPQDHSGVSPLHGYEAAADPVVRAGTHGLFYYSGIVFDRSLLRSAAFVARFMDLNNETVEPVRYIDTVLVNSFGSGQAFIDKPWLEVDVPRPGAQSVTLNVPQGSGTVSQTVPCGNVYMAWAEITGKDATLRTRIMFSRSTDCGGTWSHPVPISLNATVGQGATISIAPATGRVYVAWRQFHYATVNCVKGGLGYWKNSSGAWPVQSIVVGGVPYSRQQALAILATSPGGDATYILANQLIPAKLNVLSGAQNSVISGVIAQADAWLKAHPLGSKPGQPAKDEGLAFKDKLEAFNSGTAGTGTCDAAATGSPDAVLVVRSDNGGQTFTTPLKVATVSPFDQGTSEYSFRTNAYPSMAVDGTGSAYLSWATRGLATPNADPAAGDARIVLATSKDGTTWTTPRPIDQPNKPGHQLFPSLTFNAGKLMLVYNDYRSDASGVFEPFVVDLLGPTRPMRHTVDVRAAVADPGDVPVFTDYSILKPSPSTQVSRYPFIVTGTGASDAKSLQLQYNPPNLPMFQLGHAPFFGDYLDVAGAPRFVPNGDGTWSHNTAHSTAPVYHAVWTDNRDVVGPPDGNWSNYVPPGTGHTSLFDGSTPVPDCTSTSGAADRTQMRNQNIYTSRLTSGLFVAVPSNARPLASDFSRAFVIFVQNATSTARQFQLQILNQPAGGTASFQQFGAAAVTQADTTIGAWSSISQTVFVTSSNSTASVDVRVTELNCGSSCLQSTVRINPDSSNPPPADATLLTGETYNPAVLNPAVYNPAVYNPAVLNPAVFNPAVFNVDPSNPAVLNYEVDNPAVFNPAVLNPAVFNPAVFNPAVFNLGVTSLALLNPAVFNPAVLNPAVLNPAVFNPAVFNPAVLNPAVLNPAVFNPAVFNPAVLNPAVFNPAVFNTALTDGSVTDVNFAAQNTGNVTSAYSLNLRLGATAPSGLLYQLMIYRLYFVPVANGCELTQAAQQELLVNNLAPNLTANLLDPNGGASFFLNPGEFAIATLRVIPDKNAQPPGNPAGFNIRDLSASVVSKAVDTASVAAGSTQPAFAKILAPNLTPLVIATASLPGGVVGSAYSTTLTATGGSGPKTWSAIGALPPGLTLSTSGVLSGTPTVAGSFGFTIRVTDGTQLAERALTLTVVLMPPSASIVVDTAPTNVIGGQPFTVRFRVQDGTGGPIPGVTVSLSLASTGCSAAVLSGGLTAVSDINGNVQFLNVRIDRGGEGFTIRATSGPATATTGPVHVEGFCATGGAVETRIYASLTKLADGRVLMAGGHDSGGNTLATALIYDPVTGLFSPTAGNTNVARYHQKGILLPSGKVLIVGGAINPSSGTRVAELFDPSTGLFTPTGGQMGLPRTLCQATWVPSIQRVLITGGYFNTAEVYDPTTDAFTPTAAMAPNRVTYHSSTLLPDGRVLIAGGTSSTGGNGTAEIWNPGTGTFTATGNLVYPRQSHGAVALGDGRILILGGDTTGPVTTATAEIYDPSTGTFTQTGSMTSPRSMPLVALLPSGKVLAASGWSGQSTAEVFDPASGTFSLTGSPTSQHLWGNAVLLSTGRVLVAGGYSPAPAGELFYPTGGYTLSGRILWDNRDPIASKTSVMPVIWAGDETSGQWTPVSSSFDPATSKYTISGIKPDRIFFEASFVRPTSLFGGSPGDYFVNVWPPPLSTLSEQQRSDYTVNAYVLMRLRQPLDNSLDCNVTANATYTSPLTFTWDPVTDASQYLVVAYKTAGNVQTFYGSQQTTATAAAMTFGTSAPGESYRFWISATSSTGVYLGSSRCSGSNGYGTFGFVIVDPLVISTSSLPGGVVGSVYVQTLAATGGTGARTWSLASGSLPPGIGLSSAGVLSGTPTAPASYSFTVRVTDSGSPAQTVTQPLTLTVVSVAAPTALTFTVQPGNATGGQPMSSVAVKALDGTSLPVQGANITIAIGTSPCSAALLTGGNTATTDALGVATFSGLVINRGGWGFTLKASVASSPAVNVTSTTFNVEGFCATGSSSTNRYEATLTAITGGRVLFAGGSNTYNGNLSDGAETYDPGTGVFTPTAGNLQVARGYHQAVLLPNNQVLIIGGETAGGPTNTGEIFDPDAETFTATANQMTTPRWAFTATWVPTAGTVLIAGGAAGMVLASAELYDPTTQVFLAIGSMSSPRVWHTASLLPSGPVLVVGGVDGAGQPLSSAELWDPVSLTFKTTESLAAPRTAHAAITLSDGRALVVGGWNRTGPGGSQVPLDTAEIYDPVSGHFTLTSPMATARIQPIVSPLPSGKVLVAGGYGQGGSLLQTAEVFDPTTAKFTPTGALLTFQGDGYVALLSNGRVLVAGGPYPTAELFLPFPPTVFLVTNTADTGAGSLRQAILDANAHPGLDAIHFAIPGTGIQTISPASALPVITDAVLLDATTQPGYAGTPLIRLDGAVIPFSANGIEVHANNSLVKGFIVTRFSNTGILLTGASANHVERNFVGTDGTNALGNASGGIFVNLGSGNVINGNVVSGNGSSGILLFFGATNTAVTDNRIGTNAAGTAPLGNTYAGIYVHDTATTQNVIARNLCSGNGHTGIVLSTGTHHNTVTGNLIGSDAGGTLAVPNAMNGIVIENGSYGNRIGGTAPGAGNTIVASPNDAAVLLTNVHDNLVQGNWIGTNSAMAPGLGARLGLSISSDSYNNLIGGGAAGAGNVIAFNSLAGVAVYGSGNEIAGNLVSGNGSNGIALTGTATGTLIANNKVGTNLSGTAALGNVGDGIGIYNGASGNTVTDNVIAASTYNGIRVNLSLGNTIRRNWVGTNAALAPGLGNGNQGISVAASAGTIIGGANPGDGNVVAYNGQGGIGLESGATSTQILGNVVSGNAGSGIGVIESQTATIAGNLVGTNPAGTAAWANSVNGISVSGTMTTAITIGGTAPGAGNLIAGNGRSGVFLSGGASGNSVTGNLIGTNSAFANLGNAYLGIEISNAAGNMIGGSALGAGNTIAFNQAGATITSGNNTQVFNNVVARNASHGIMVTGTTGGTIASNKIGTDPSGTAPAGNGGFGVYLEVSATGLTISQNLISANGEGIRLHSSPGNTIRGNTIGTDVTRTVRLPNGNGVVLVVNSSGTLLGGTGTGDGNVIAGNNGVGLWIQAGCDSTNILGNWIGTNPALASGLGNTSAGVILASSNNAVGNSGPGAGNVIAHNGSVGVWVSSGTGNLILSNSLFGNGSLGISFVTDLLNAPALSSAVDNGSSTVVTGSVDIGVPVPGVTITVQLFANATCEHSPYGEGETLLRTIGAVTDGGGIAHFTAILPTGLLGKVITATATNPAPGGTTSEFSMCRTVSP